MPKTIIEKLLVLTCRSLGLFVLYIHLRSIRLLESAQGLYMHQLIGDAGNHACPPCDESPLTPFSPLISCQQTVGM